MSEEGNVLLVHLRGWRADNPICLPEFLYGNTLRGSHRNVKMFNFEETTGSCLVHLSAFIGSFMYLTRSKAGHREGVHTLGPRGFPLHPAVLVPAG